MLRGEKLKGLPKVEIAALMKDPSAREGKTICIEGTVRKACEKKGCWMEVAAAGDAKGPGVRVKFKDYGFFVPLDSEGSTVKLEGVVSVTELSEDRVKHYEGEGATVPRGKDGKARDPLAQFATEKGLPVHQPTSWKTPEALELMRQPDQ